MLFLYLSWFEHIFLSKLASQDVMLGVVMNWMEGCLGRGMTKQGSHPCLLKQENTAIPFLRQKERNACFLELDQDTGWVKINSFLFKYYLPFSDAGFQVCSRYSKYDSHCVVINHVINGNSTQIFAIGPLTFI